MLFKDVVSAIEQTARPRSAASWDLSGLQTASSRDHVEHLAVFLDPAPAYIREALDRGADCTLSHHPLTLSPRLPDRLDNWREALSLLLCSDIPLYAAHTSLDVNMAGPAGWLGRELGLRNARILDPVQQTPDEILGYGEIGDLPKPLSLEELCGRVTELANISEAMLCGPEPKEPVRRIAWCGGSGGSLIDRAARAGAQVFITGDIKHHAAMDASITVIDVGHFSIEEKMMRIFADHLASVLPEMQVSFIEGKPPFRAFRA